MENVRFLFFFTFSDFSVLISYKKFVNFVNSSVQHFLENFGGFVLLDTHPPCGSGSKRSLRYNADPYPHHCSCVPNCITNVSN